MSWPGWGGSTVKWYGYMCYSSVRGSGSLDTRVDPDSTQVFSFSGLNVPWSEERKAVVDALEAWLYYDVHPMTRHTIVEKPNLDDVRNLMRCEDV